MSHCQNPNCLAMIPLQYPLLHLGEHQCGGGGWLMRGNTVFGHIDPYTTASLFSTFSWNAQLYHANFLFSILFLFFPFISYWRTHFVVIFIGTLLCDRRALSRRLSDLKFEYLHHMLYPHSHGQVLATTNSRQAPRFFGHPPSPFFVQHPWLEPNLDIHQHPSANFHTAISSPHLAHLLWKSHIIYQNSYLANWFFF
jgi:hypothetical protein